MVTCREQPTRVVRNINDGRGSMAIALQVKAETGSQVPIQELKAEIDIMMNSWKTETYVDAWSYMEWCAAQPEAEGFLENPWGRKRLFAQTNDRNILRAYGREAMNFPKLLEWGSKTG